MGRIGRCGRKQVGSCGRFRKRLELPTRRGERSQLTLRAPGTPSRALRDESLNRADLLAGDEEQEAFRRFSHDLLPVLHIQLHLRSVGGDELWQVAVDLLGLVIGYRPRPLRLLGTGRWPANKVHGQYLHSSG